MTGKFTQVRGEVMRGSLTHFFQPEASLDWKRNTKNDAVFFHSSIGGAAHC